MQFNQVRLLVTNFDACFRFYRDVLKLPVQFGNEGDVYADFTIGDGLTLALFDRRQMALAVGMGLPPDTETQSVVLVFGVDDLPAAVSDMLQHNIELVALPTDRPEWGMQTAHFRDPDGNLIELFVPLPAQES